MSTTNKAVAIHNKLLKALILLAVLCVVPTTVLSEDSHANHQGDHSNHQDDHSSHQTGHSDHQHEAKHDHHQEYKWSQSSESGLSTAKVFPQEGKPVFNDYHNWIVKLSDDQGQPIRDAKIAIDGGMEAHGHGLPSKPVVSREINDGEYLIEGMLFNMIGAWTLVLDVLSSHENTRFTFPLELSH